MKYPNGRILIFAKAPLPGYAKTRLIPVLGAQGAADLHAGFIRRTVTLAVESRLSPVEIWTCGGEGLEFFDAFQSTVDGRIYTQTGTDLGARMGHAMEHALGRADFAVLIGTDCPALGHADLAIACASLATGCDVALGPAEDGGYVLIGLRRADPALFENIAWGTSDVLRQTRERILRRGWSCHELPTLWDVDHPQDLERLDAAVTSTTS